MSESVTIREIRESYAEHPGFRHWFWGEFAKGALGLNEVRRFALAYYEHVKRFRLYIAGALTIAPSEQLQIVLAENIADEYGIQLEGEPSSDSHPQLFRRFMQSLGLSEGDWTEQTPLAGIRRFQEIHFALFRGGLVAETIGAVVFGMEATTPYRHGMVIEGLERMERPREGIDNAFFAQHVTGDEEHSRELIAVATPIIEEDPSGVARGARLSFDARKVFLDDLAQHVGLHREE